MKDIQHYNRRQGYGVTLTIEDVGVLLRARVYIDSYTFQSFAVGEAWDGHQWQEVYTLHPNETDRVGVVAFGAPSYATKHDELKQEFVLGLAWDVITKVRWVLGGVVVE